MSKFLAVDHRLINTNSITNIICNKDTLNFSFQLPDNKSFKKSCKDEAEFQEIYDLLLKELDVVNLSSDKASMFNLDNI